MPSNTTANSDGKSFTIAQNNSVTIPVTYSFVVTNPGAATEGVRMVGIQWSSTPGGAVTLFTIPSSGSNSTWRTTLIYQSDPNALSASIWDAIKEYFAEQHH
jgi:hypothetical protein